jgi:hypothetical protein
MIELLYDIEGASVKLPTEDVIDRVLVVSPGESVRVFKENAWT